MERAKKRQMRVQLRLIAVTCSFRVLPDHWLRAVTKESNADIDDCFGSQWQSPTVPTAAV